MSINKSIEVFFLVWLASVQKTYPTWRSYGISKKFYKQLEEVLNRPLLFSSNSGSYYFFSSESHMTQDCACLKKSAFSVIQVSITSNLEQSELLVYFLGYWTFKRKRLKQSLYSLPEMDFPSISVITGEPVSTTVSIALFWWSRKFTYFSFFILIQFCYW